MRQIAMSQITMSDATPTINQRKSFMHRLGILLSGRGSNFLAIAKAISEQRLQGAEIAVVLSNVEDAPGLAAAHALQLPAFALPSAGRKRAEHDAEMIALLHQHKVDLVCLAGYMRIISPAFIAAFPNRILNVHPSLLPAFPGLDRSEEHTSELQSQS